MSRILFQLTAFATTVFVITILAMIAMMLGDPAAPINVWFNRQGTVVLLGEVAAVVLFGLAAMNADRRESQRIAAQSHEEPSSRSEAADQGDHAGS